MTKKEDLLVVKPTTTIDEGICAQLQLYCLRLFWTLIVRNFFLCQIALEMLVEIRITSFLVIDDNWMLVVGKFAFFFSFQCMYGLRIEQYNKKISALFLLILYEFIMNPCSVPTRCIKDSSFIQTASSNIVVEFYVVWVVPFVNSAYCRDFKGECNRMILVRDLQIALFV